MITAILSIIIFCCLFYGKISPLMLTILSLGIGILILIFGRHGHTQILSIDVKAQTSRLNIVNPTLKFCATIALMLICISSSTPIAGLFLFVISLLLIVLAGGLNIHEYICLLLLPISFILVSGLALIFEISSNPIGLFNVHFFSIYFCVTNKTQQLTSLVIGRAFGALSCLYFLSLTTPMSELIGVLRKFHCPNIFIDLMYLIYRYIFILFSMYYSMKNSAKSRLGFRNYATSIRTTSKIYSNLLSRSYVMASINFDAMESRCYDSKICFLEVKKNVTILHVFIAMCITIATLIISLFSL